MQEHIRRAHPEHYIPKLPATEESFLLMINSPPSEHRADQAPTSTPQSLSLLTCLILQATDRRLLIPTTAQVPMTDEITTAMAPATPAPLATVMNIP